MVKDRWVKYTFAKDFREVGCQSDCFPKAPHMKINPQDNFANMIVYVNFCTVHTRSVWIEIVLR